MLMNALRQIAESLGYRFLAGREEQLAPLTRGLPAVWVTPLRLRKAEGRAWRRDTYAVRLRLIAPSVSQEPEAGWQTLEADASRMFTQLGQAAGVRYVEGLKVTPDEQPVVLREAVSVTAEFDAVVCYYQA